MPTRHTRRQKEIEDVLANDPTLPPFWPEERPSNITEVQWDMTRRHVFEHAPVAHLAEEYGMNSRLADVEITRVFTELTRQWQAKQQPSPDNDVWIIPCHITVTGPKTREQALLVAQTWQKLTQINTLPSGKRVTKVLTVGRNVQTEPTDEKES